MAGRGALSAPGIGGWIQVRDILVPLWAGPWSANGLGDGAVGPSCSAWGGLRLPFPARYELVQSLAPGDRLVITAPGQTVQYRVTAIELLSDRQIQAFWECVGSGQAMLIAPYEVIRGGRLVVWATLE